MTEDDKPFTIGVQNVLFGGGVEMVTTLPAGPYIVVPRRPAKLPSQLLVQRGWCRDKVEDRRGRLCLAGAIYESSLRLSFTRQALTAMLQQVVEELVGHRISIPAWNDRRTTTFDDVLVVAREAERRLGWRE
jgi:hypothetical protein